MGILYYGRVSRYHTWLLMLEVLGQHWIDSVDSRAHTLHLIHSIHVEHSIRVLTQLILSMVMLISQLT